MGENLPAAGKFVTPSLKSLFKETIDQIISDLGREVKLFFRPTSTQCPNCGTAPDGSSNGIYNTSNPNPVGSRLNKPFPNGAVCYVCRGENKIFTENSQTYTATIGRAPKDLDFEQEGVFPENVVTTKMQIAAFNDIKRTQKALIDGDFYTLIRQPTKTGLKDLFYVRAVWKKITD